MNRMSGKRSVRGGKRDESKNTRREWPTVVYFWILGLGFLGYLVVEIGWRESIPHPFHWLAGIAGAILGVPLGWLWYRWRGDVI